MVNGLGELLRRPAFGAAVAALLIFGYFSTTTSAFLSPAGAATWLHSSSLYGVMVVAIALLLIGGEFDLSAGVMTGTTGLVVGVTATKLGVHVMGGVVLALLIALGIGALNGFVVHKTGLPSFIVTLATFFILQGMNLALTKLITGSVQIGGLSAMPGFDEMKAIFGSTFTIGGITLKVSILWFIAATLIGTWVLQRTRFGNWVFAVGGQASSAREVGIPVRRVKITLFMTTAGAGWLVGMIQLFDVSTVQATTGIGQEFIYIICAVVGGCLLTGGFGSVIGGAFGAIIFGMASQGIVFARLDSNWLMTFLGALLLAAVLVNHYIRKRAGGRA